MNTQTSTAFVPATERQMAFIADLLRAIDPDNAAEDMLAIEQADSPLTKAGASREIERLIGERDRVRKVAKAERQQAQQAEQGTPSATDLSEGFYRAGNGDIYQVFQARHGSHLLAKVLDQETGKFEYAGAAKRFVKADQRMTLEEAQEYGKQTGICMVCSRRLTAPESVEAGIGPVCARRF